MAQHDYDIANASGATVRADLNSVLDAIATNNSGATAPSTTHAYQWWADTGNGLLKIRNAANDGWVTVGTLANTNLGLLDSGNNLSELTATASTARTNLGLGDSATKNVGTGSSQVAAGDHTHTLSSLNFGQTGSSKITSNQVFTYGSGYLSFDSAIVTDTDIWSGSNPTKFYVPTGVTKVRVKASVQFTVGTAGYFNLYFAKNGSATFDGNAQIQIDISDTGINHLIYLETIVLSVTAGDYFEVTGASHDSSTRTAQATSHTWMELEVIN